MTSEYDAIASEVRGALVDSAGTSVTYHRDGMDDKTITAIIGTLGQTKTSDERSGESLANVIEVEISTDETSFGGGIAIPRANHQLTLPNLPERVVVDRVTTEGNVALLACRVSRVIRTSRAGKP